MKIICVRHGKPEFTYPKGSQLISAGHFNDLISAYDEAGLDQAWNRQRDRGLHTGTDLYTLSSDLPRALETAMLCTGRQPDRVSKIFREVPLPRFKHAGWKLPGFLFMLLSRASWYLGNMPSHERRARTFVRVRHAADELETEARQHDQVLLFSHGFFLWLLGRELIRRGWESDKHGPYRYLEQATFTR